MAQALDPIDTLLAELRQRFWQHPHPAQYCGRTQEKPTPIIAALARHAGRAASTYRGVLASDPRGGRRSLIHYAPGQSTQALVNIAAPLCTALAWCGILAL